LQRFFFFFFFFSFFFIYISPPTCIYTRTSCLPDWHRRHCGEALWRRSHRGPQQFGEETGFVQVPAEEHRSCVTRWEVNFIFLLFSTAMYTILPGFHISPCGQATENTHFGLFFPHPLLFTLVTMAMIKNISARKRGCTNLESDLEACGVLRRSRRRSTLWRAAAGPPRRPGQARRRHRERGGCPLLGNTDALAHRGGPRFPFGMRVHGEEEEKNNNKKKNTQHTKKKKTEKTEKKKKKKKLIFSKKKLKFNKFRGDRGWWSRLR
jgi:hypothetical protein